MKRKFGTVMDDDIMRQAKRRAAEKGVPLSDVIQEALEAYLNGSDHNPKERMEAYNRFCGQPMKLNPVQLKAVLESDAWE